MGKRCTSTACTSIPRTPSSPQEWKACLKGVAIEVVTDSHTPDQFQSYTRYSQRYGCWPRRIPTFMAPGRAIAT
jgi:hypothetical protein